MDQFDKQMQQFDALPQQEKLRRLQGFDDDSMQAFGQQYANWRKNRVAKAQQTAVQNLGQRPGAVSMPKAGSQFMQPGSKSGAALRGISHGASFGFIDNLAGGASAAAMLGGKAVQPILGLVNERAAQQAATRLGQGFGVKDAGKMGALQAAGNVYDEQVKASRLQQAQAQRQQPFVTTASQFGGGFLTPLPSVTKVGGKQLPTMARYAAGGLIGGGLTGAGTSDSDSVSQTISDTATGAAAGAVAGPILGKAMQPLGKIPGKFEQLIATRLGPKAMTMVRSLANSILSARGVPQSAIAYTNPVKSPSKLGLANRWQDMLYYVVNYLKPQVLEPVTQRNARLGQLVQKAGQRSGFEKKRMMQTEVDADQLLSQVTKIARGSQLDASQQGGVGKQAASIIRDQYLQVPGQIAQAARPTRVDLGIQDQVLPAKKVSFGTTTPKAPQQQPLVTVVPQKRRVKLSSGKMVKRPLQAQNVVSSGQTPDQIWRPDEFGQQIVPDQSIQLPGVYKTSDPAASYRKNMSGTSGASIRYSGDPQPQTQQVLAKTQSLKKLAGDIGPMKSKQLPSDDVAGRFFDPMQGQMSVNQTLAQVRPRQQMQLPSQIQKKKIPLGQLQIRRQQLEGGQYNPNPSKISTPQVAVSRSNQLIEDYLYKKAGYSPRQTDFAKQAGDMYHIASKTHGIMAQHGQPGAGMTANTPIGQLLGAAGQAIKQRTATAALKPAQAVSNKAIQILNKWQQDPRQVFGTDVAQRMPFMRPSQKAQLIAKFEAIARMRPQDGRVFAFAQSVANPLFRQVWMIAQRGQEQGNE